MAEEKKKSSEGPRVAEIIDTVVWDYDPEDDQPSPLVSTQRYFRDFPWEPEEVMSPGPIDSPTERE